MKFLLTALKLFYVLDPNLMRFPTASDEDTDEIKAQRKKWEEDELICREHILNTLSDHLYDLYTSMKSPKEIWNALEARYKIEKLIMRDSFQDMEDSDSKALKFIQQNDTEMQGIDELNPVTCEMVRLIETATIPIVKVDSAGLING
ncbi:hypothetical protein SO802_007602 [Lithocarpus litseifolius]|uniref:Uncharacterized protein n=1 Tax=Lithocarpus litseifolius TaxID=425828 RepID=A0AAW2DQU4_9ROSI